MNNLKNNLIFLRKKKGLTQAEAAAALGLKRGTVANYETGHTEPNIETILLIADFFGVDPGILISKDFKNVHLNEKLVDEKKQENVHLNVHPNVHLRTPKWGISDNVKLSIVGEDQVNYGQKWSGNVYDFDTKAAAGMAQILADKDKLNQLPTLYIPNLGPGIHIRCQVTGDSMHGTIKDGDHVIAILLQNPMHELREGFIHVVFDKDDGIVCKRLYKADKHHLELVSDNDTYTPYKRHFNDLLALFKVVEVHTRDLRNYFNDTRREVSKLWKAIDDINERLPKLK